MKQVVKYNLTPQNKQEWEDLGWDTRASNIDGVGTFDWSDTFVDDNFGWIIHNNGMQIYDRTDLNVEPYFGDIGLTNFHKDYNNETLVLIKTMFDKGLLYVDEVKTND